MARRDGMLRLELNSLHLASAGGCSVGYWCARPICAALLSLLHGGACRGSRDDRAGGARQIHSRRIVTPPPMIALPRGSFWTADRTFRGADALRAAPSPPGRPCCSPRPFRRSFRVLLPKQQAKAVQRGPCVWVDSGIFISPSPSGRPALAPACARIRLAFPLAGDQRNYLSRTNRALRQAPTCQYCSL